LPWDKAKAFNGSAPVSGFVGKQQFQNLQDINFSLQKNGTEVQKGNTQLMLWKIDEIISHISTFFTLKTGDILFTGTPAGVGPCIIGDKLEAFIEGNKMLEVNIK
jgi:acylpyruvate hydrolase